MHHDVKRSYHFAIIPEWVLYHQDLDAVDVRVFGALDRHDGADCFPALATVGELIGKSEQTVRRSLRNLAAVGAILIEPRFENGRQASNRYMLAGDSPMTMRPVKVDRAGVSPVIPGDPVMGDTRSRAIDEPEQSNQSASTTRAADVPLIVVDSQFDAFWNAYPRKMGKPAALKAWKSVDGNRCAKTIAAGLARWVDYWTWRNEPEYVPHPATWLNQRRWEDDTPPRTRRNGSAKASTMDKLREVEFNDNGMMVDG